MIEEWQRRWDENHQTGHWTKKLIPSIREWVECKHRRTCYEVTQVLSGHGSFGTYTQRLQKTDANCVYCNEIDDVEHTIFHCPRWHARRMHATLLLGSDLTPRNMVQKMMSSADAWETVQEMLKEIMREKEREEVEHRNRLNVRV